MVLLIGLLAVGVAPRFGLLEARTLDHRADQLAACLELARERAIVTQIPHRVLFDLDAQIYRLEWYTREADDEAAADELDGAEGLVQPSASAAELSAPRDAERAYRPVPGSAGNTIELEPSLVFAGFEGETGFQQQGEAALEFYSDGSAQPGRIEVQSDNGSALALEVLPFLPEVRWIESQG